MRHFDVQLMGGMVLHGGNIAEMVTGEGKTLVATLAAYLNALDGRGVHVVTVNDYLARRDAEWMSPLFQGLGMTVGAIQSEMESGRAAGDLQLRHHLRHQQRVRLRLSPRQHEADQGDAGPGRALLRDHRRGGQHPDRRGPDAADHLGAGLRRRPQVRRGRPDRPPAQADAHFEVKEKERTCHLNDEGIREAERIAGLESFYTPGNMEWPHLIDNALKAHYLYRRDRDYVVQPDGEVVIVDEFTGRLMIGRQWSDGLHQAVEAKERVKIKEENQTLATITLQNFFKLYKKLAGMTGTAMTEATEFYKVYTLDVVAIPTNRAAVAGQLFRRDLPLRAGEDGGDPRRDPRGPRDRPAGAGRDDLDREVRGDLAICSAGTGSRTRS